MKPRKSEGVLGLNTKSNYSGNSDRFEGEVNRSALKHWWKDWRRFILFFCNPPLLQTKFGGGIYIFLSFVQTSLNFVHCWPLCVNLNGGRMFRSIEITLSCGPLDLKILTLLVCTLSSLLLHQKVCLAHIQVGRFADVHDSLIFY